MLKGLPVSPSQYSDGVRKERGSTECPQGYKQITDQAECRKVAEGACLSTRKSDCDLWSKRVIKGTKFVFAKNFGDGNQPGCSFDYKDGVLFNTRTSWSGKHNENDDRPICTLISGAGLVEENEVNVTAFISLADQADPAKVKKVIGLIENLIKAAKAEIASLKKAVDDARVKASKAQEALNKATGIWKAAVSDRLKKKSLFDVAVGEYNSAKNHADQRIPVLKSEIASINEAIELIKSLEE